MHGTRFSVSRIALVLASTFAPLGCVKLETQAEPPAAPASGSGQVEISMAGDWEFVYASPAPPPSPTSPTMTAPTVGTVLQIDGAEMAMLGSQPLAETELVGGGEWQVLDYLNSANGHFALYAFDRRNVESGESVSLAIALGSVDANTMAGEVGVRVRDAGGSESELRYGVVLERGHAPTVGPR